MSEKRPLSALERVEALIQANAAMSELDRLNREHTWRTCIPVQSTDSDVVLSKAIDSIGRYEATVQALEIKRGKAKRIVVCLCGSTRFSEAFREANLRETLAGKIVLTIGCDMRSDADVFAGMSESALVIVKAQLDDLHLDKINLADEVLILNIGDYVGESTRRELSYARIRGKRVRWLEPSQYAEEGEVSP